MSKLIKGNHKHLTLKDRTIIEVELNKGSNLSYIAKLTCKDPTTISREIQNNRLKKPSNAYSKLLNHCQLRTICKRTLVCNKCFRNRSGFIKNCSSCTRCNNNCKDFIQEFCPTCKYAPYVCNACNKRNCNFDKFYYKAESANRLYRERLITSRQGFNLTEKEMLILDNIVTPLIQQGQSPYQIIANNNDIPVSSRTLYKYIEAGALTAKNIHLLRKVRYKPRKKQSILFDDKGIYINRTFEDFTEYCAFNKDINVVEMDTVIGLSENSKVLLTLYFRNCKFMMAYLLEKKLAKNVINIFDMLEEKLGLYTFKRTFPIILTDRGSEFRRPDEIEMAKDLSNKTLIFYCNPQAPYQKGMLEKNHEYIRYILPKGTSFDKLTQTKVNIMMSHINSTKRASLNGMSPFELASQLLPKEAMKVFNIKKIDGNDINLTPSLI